MKRALVIFAKNKIKGAVKTRLAASVGKDIALRVYEKLLSHTAAITCDLPVNKMVFYSGFIDKQDEWNNGVYEKRLQVGQDLGERMENAFNEVINEGYEKVVIIGTDCYELTAATIMNAFAALHLNEVVIGPATDGGYYLLGMKKMQDYLFQNITWSTPAVLSETCKACKKHGTRYSLLNQLPDIDNEADLDKVKAALLQEKLPG